VLRTPKKERMRDYKVSELANMLGVSIFTIYRWIREGRLEYYKLFNRYRIPKDKVKGLVRDENSL